MACAVAAAAVQTWFRPSSFIATGDLAPFLGRGLEPQAGSLWNHLVTGAGSVNFQISLAPQYVTVRIVGLLGGSEMLAQRLFFTALIVAAAAGGALFASVFTRRPVVIATAALLTVFNPMMMVQTLDPLIPATLAVCGIVGGLLLSAAEGRRPHPLLLGLATAVVSLLALNPPLVVACLVWVILVVVLSTAMFGRQGTQRAGILLLRATPWAVGLNLWWLVPFVLSFVTGSGSSTFQAQTNVSSWAWTHARDSISNVLTLNSSWAWVYKQYYPYAASVDQPWWEPLKFALPILAFAGPLVAPRNLRCATKVLLGLVLVLIFVGKGLHPPLTAANSYLYRVVPGFFLLREPSAKIGPLLVLLYVGLASLTLERGVGMLASARSSGRRVIDRRSLLAATPCLAALGAIVYPWPMWSGAVIPEKRPVLPSARVHFPTEWRQAATWFDHDHRPGKVLVLPRNDFYQMPTTWGYLGTDFTPQLTIRKPTIVRLPGNYFGDTPAYDNLTASVEQALLSGDLAAVPPLLRSLGVTSILLRHDFDLNYPGHTVADPDVLEAALARLPELHVEKTNRLLALYTVSDPEAQIFRAAHQLYATPPDDQLGAAIGSLGDHAVLAPPAVAPGPLSVGSSEVHAGLKANVGGGLTDISIRLNAPRLFRVGMTEPAPGQHALRFQPLETTKLGGQSLLPSDPEIPVGAEDIAAIQIAGRTVPVGGDAVVAVGGDDRVHLFARTAPARRPILSPVGDCNAFDSRTPNQVGIATQDLASEPKPAFQLRAMAHSACRVIDSTANRGVPYLVSFEYRTTQGQPARVCLATAGRGSCLLAPRLPSSPEWQRFETIVYPGQTRLVFSLFADGSDGKETVTEYRAVQLEPLADAGTAQVDLPAPVHASIPPGTDVHIATAEVSEGPHLGALEQVGDCHAFVPATLSTLGISATPIDSPAGGLGVQLHAGGHVACIAAPVISFVPGIAYDVSLEYRTVAGRGPRMCIEELLAQTLCSPSPPMLLSKSWHQINVSVSPSTLVKQVRIVLFADAPASGETRVEYRNIQLRSATPVAVVTRGVSQPGMTPTISARRMSESDYKIDVAGAQGPFFLTMADAFAPGWHLRGPGASSAVHFMADGYANGWRLDRPGSYELTVSFDEARWAHLAIPASEAALAFALLSSVYGLIRRRWR